jgi:hypothetical protein
MTLCKRDASAGGHNSYVVHTFERVFDAVRPR